MSLLNETVFRALARTSPGLSDAAEGRIYFDSGTNTFLVSENGGAYVDLATAADVTLQNAYNGAGVGAGRAVNLNGGAITFTDNNADNNDVLQITRNPVGSQSGVGLAVTMGANTTGNAITVTQGGSGLAALFSGATISVPGAGGSSERFGAGATSAGASAVAVGNAATGSGAGSTALGSSTSTGGFAGAIALGAGATNTAANQLVAGSSTQAITSVILGNGDTNGTPSNVTVRVTDSSAAATAGGNLTLRSGVGNTTGAGGALTVQAGSGGATSGTGGAVLVAGGTGGASNGNGGLTTVRAGNASGTGTGANLVLGGGVSPSGAGGTVSLQTGSTTLLERLFVPNDGGLEWIGLAAAPSLSAAADARIYFNSTDNLLYLSVNGGAYSPIATGGSLSLQGAYNGGSTIAEDATNPVTITNAAAQTHAVLVLTQGTAGQNVITASGGNIALSGGNFVVGSTFGLDTSGAGTLNVGNTNATTVNVGSGATTAVNITATTTTITGDLTVNGTVTTINTTNLTVTDALIYGNNGAGSASAGIAWDRQATTNDAIFLWSEANTRFEIGLNDTSGGTVTPASLSTFSNVKLSSLFLAGTAITADAGLTLTATAATLTLAATGANAVNLATNGSTRWSVSSAGNYVPGADATYTIGTQDTLRPTSVFASTSLVAGTTTGASITVGASTIVGTQAIAVTTGDNAAGAGYAFSATAGNATAGNNAGGLISLTCGNGSGTAAGGALTMTAGTGGGTDGAGGAVSLIGGLGGATDGAGGATLVRAGNGSGAGAGAALTLAGGISGTGSGGNVLIQTGNTSLTTRVTVLPSGNVGVATTPTSKFHGFGSSAFRLQTFTGNTTLGDQTFALTDASGGAVTITLPTAVGISDRIYYIKKSDSSSNYVTVATTGGQTIDGAASFALKIGGEAIMVVSDGANWWKF